MRSCHRIACTHPTSSNHATVPTLRQQFLRTSTTTKFFNFLQHCLHRNKPHYQQHKIQQSANEKLVGLIEFIHARSQCVLLILEPDVSTCRLLLMAVIVDNGIISCHDVESYVPNARLASTIESSFVHMPLCPTTPIQYQSLIKLFFSCQCSADTAKATTVSPWSQKHNNQLREGIQEQRHQ